MKNFDWYKITLISSIVCLAVTCYMIQDAIRYASDNLSGHNNNTTNSRDTIVRYIPSDLSTKGNLFYFQGNFESYNRKVSDMYEYDTSFPEEIWRGYFSLARNNKNVSYLIWTKTPINSSIVNISGYFTCISNTDFQFGDGYSKLLIPVFSKNFNE